MNEVNRGDGGDVGPVAAEAVGPEAPSSRSNGEQKKAKSSGLSLSNLRLSQDFGASLGVKKQLVTVPVKKPDRQVFFRVHPEWQLHAAVLEVKEDGQMFVVDPEIAEEVGSEVSPRMIVPAVTRQGVTILWPLRLPGSDGRLDDWGRSAMAAADAARTQWVRMAANRALGAYEIFTGTMPAEPQWPDVTFDELVQVAFKDHFIEDLNHPVLKGLRGEL